MHIVPPVPGPPLLPAARPGSYDDLVEGIYTDYRMSPGAREVALALAWILHRDPTDHEWIWHRLAACVDFAGDGTRLRTLIAQDLPCYLEPEGTGRYGGPCEAPRKLPYRPRSPHLQRLQARDPDRFARLHPPGQCGTHTTSRGLPEHDPDTGWVVAWHWYCPRHTALADTAEAALPDRAEWPAPLPNRGGTLPVWFHTDWTRIYQWAAPGWQPPAVGVCADDWGEGEDQPPTWPPVLTLITSEGPRPRT